MLAKKKLNRLLSSLLAVIMVLGLLPTAAFAAAPSDSADQIGQYYALDESNNLVAESAANDPAQTIENGAITMEKRVEATNTENQFKVTLNVTTTEDIDKLHISPSAGVVLVMDVSNSMNTVTSKNSTRMEDAKTAAKDFVDTFSDVTQDPANPVKRMVSVVQFGTHAERVLSWLDVTDQKNLESVKTAISGMDYKKNNYSDGVKDGGTNIEGGLQLAYNQLDDDKVKGIDSLYVIMLTDGQPTCHIDKGANRTSDTYIKGAIGGGDHSNYEDYYPVYAVAGNILTKAKLFSITYGSATNTVYEKKGTFTCTQTGWHRHDDLSGGKTGYLDQDGKFHECGGRDCDNWSWSWWRGWVHMCTDHWFNGTHQYTADHDVTVEEWLKEFSTNVYSTTNDIKKIFKDIATQIEKLAKAWKVTDPMSDYVKFGGFETTKPESILAYDGDTGTIAWNLRNDSPTVGGSDSRKTFTYSVSYYVTLNSLASTVQAGTYYPLNKITTLDYAITSKTIVNGQETSTLVIDSADFLIPTAKCCDAGTLTFTKKAYGEPLAGAVFTLTHKSDCACGISSNWSATATSGNDGTVSFSGIPSGHTYTLTETAPAGYTAAGPYDVKVAWGALDESGTTVPNVVDNKFSEEYTTIPVTKIWVDGGSANRPSITLTLTQYKGDTATGKTWEKTLTSADAVDGQPTQWSYTFGASQTEKLPIKDVNDNTPYTYKVTESAVSGYSTSYSDDTYTVTNYANDKTSVSGTKTWIDSETGHPDIEIELLANGEPLSPAKTVTLKSGETSYSFPDLPKYDADGEIIYTVRENTDLANYSEEQDGTNFTNRINQTTTTVSVSKVWFDNSDAYGTRPDTITVNLLADGEVVSSAELSSANAAAGNANLWSYTFTTDAQGEALPVYRVGSDGKVNGEKIRYTLSEDEIGTVNNDGDSYECKVMGNIITNTLTGTISISGTKSWVEPDGAERPQISFIIPGTGRTTELKADGTYSFEDLPKYYASGEKINYSAVEVQYAGDGSADTHYVPEKDGDDFTNYYHDTTVVSGTKTWLDNDNAYSTRPSSVTVELYADNEPTGKTVVLDGTADEGLAADATGEYGAWQYRFTGLEEYRYETVVVEEATPDTPAVTEEVAVKIVYSVKEARVSGYVVSYDGFNITNTLTGTTSVSGTKTWNDNNNAYGTRPETITFKLYQNGGAEAFRTTTIGKNDAGYSFDNLPMYDSQGVKYTYTVSEDAVHGYTSTPNGYNFTNDLQQQYTKVEVSKTWIDGGRTDRPDITITLKRDGEPFGTTTLKSPTVTHTFGVDSEGKETLPVFKFDGDGKVTGKYAYTVEEAPVEGYDTTISGFGITNKLKEITTDPTTSLTFTKQWAAPEGYNLPEAIFTIYQSGAEYRTVSSKDMTYDAVKGLYTYTASNLPKFSADGHTAYTYTVEETTVPTDFTSSRAAGNSFLNTIKPGEAALNGSKTWTLQPEATRDDYSITVEVWRDKSFLFEQKIASDKAQFTFSITNDLEGKTLPKYATDGHEYTYELKEKAVDGFTAGSSTANGVTSFTNTYKTYQYQVNYHYTATIDGTVVVDNEVQTGSVETRYHGDQTVSLTPDAAREYTAADGSKYTYTYQNSTLTVEDDVSALTGSPISVHLSKDGVTYVIDLYYAYSYTTPYDPGTSTKYDITVNYLEQGTGKVLHEQHTERHRSGYKYDVTGFDAISIDGYTYVETTGDALTGTLNRDKVINVWYTAEADLPEPSTPLDPKPSVTPEPTPEPSVTPEPTPEPPVTPEPGIDIEEPDTPKGDLPQTGMVAAPVEPSVTLGLVALAFSLVGAGLHLTFGRKKAEDEE